MTIKNIVATSILSASLIFGGVAIAQTTRNVSPSKHPNLAAAQRLVSQAYNRILDAQKANEFDLGGHAEKAKQLLEQASNELKQAAEVANKK